jgi:acetoin utilization deacetylase AcuC-like enzyme
VVTGHLTNAVALVRPPGHHAEAGRAMGFACLTTWRSPPNMPAVF